MPNVKVEFNSEECRTPTSNTAKCLAPTPKLTPPYFYEEQLFSSKKARTALHRNAPPPPPPFKSCPPLFRSRLFNPLNLSHKAQAVSFRENSDSSMLGNRHYDESANESFFDQCFYIEGLLGSGSFGDVYKVKHKADGKLYAVKVSKAVFRGDNDRKRKLAEVKRHEQLPKHRNCVKFVQAWEENRRLYIQTELCQTSLNEYSENNHDIPEKLIWKYLVDLLLAVQHLHNHDLVHMDIKPDNIFISMDGVCKLGDFGLVIDLKKRGDQDSEGDPRYLAPEVLQEHYTTAADIFSLGVTILELATDLAIPKGGEGWHMLRRGEIPQEFLNRLSPELHDIIMRMLEPDYKKRITASELLAMPSLKRVQTLRHLMNSVGVKLTTVWDWSYRFSIGILMLILLPISMLLRVQFKKYQRPCFTPPSCRKPPRHPITPTDVLFSDDEDLSDLHADSIMSLEFNSSSSSGSDDRFFLYKKRLVQPSSSTPSSKYNRSPHVTPDASPVFARPRSGSSFEVEPRNLINMFDAANQD